MATAAQRGVEVAHLPRCGPAWTRSARNPSRTSAAAAARVGSSGRSAVRPAPRQHSRARSISPRKVAIMVIIVVPRDSYGGGAMAAHRASARSRRPIANYASTGVGSLNHLAPEEPQAPVQGGTVARALWRRRTSDPGRGGRSGQHDLAQPPRCAARFRRARSSCWRSPAKRLADSAQRPLPWRSPVFPDLSPTHERQPRLPGCHDQEADPRFQRRAGRPGRPQEIGRGGLRDRGLRRPCAGCLCEAEYER